MKKILITPNITDLNRGDQALIWLIRDFLKHYNLSPEIALLNSGNKEESEKQTKQSIENGFRILDPIIQHPSRLKKEDQLTYSRYTLILWGLIAIHDYLKSKLLLSRFKFINKLGYFLLNQNQKKTFDWLHSSDALFVKGGGFLHSYGRITDKYYVYYVLFDIMLAQKMNKKVIIFPNSFGPIKGKIEQNIAKKTLAKANLILTREHISFDFLHNELGLNDHIHSVIDLAFFIDTFNKNKINSIKYDKKNKLVGITVRPYRFPESKKNKGKLENYINAIYEFSKYIISENYTPVYIAQTLGPSKHEDDTELIKSLVELLDKNNIDQNKYIIEIDNDMNCYDIQKNVYSKLDYIIGTRFHSVIFSFTANVPAIAISYSGNKTYGIMKDMNLEDYVLDISTISTDQLVDKFNMIVNNTEEYRDNLVRFNNSKINKMNEMFKFITEALGEKNVNNN
jgi:colanic acid/amylovoran biosynthesis protein